MIKLRMTASVALRLETAVKETYGLEFSGLGFAKEERGGLVIYDVVVLHVGSEAYTEIDPTLLFPLMDREDSKNLRVWFHRHPVGNGVPGPHCWSGTDENTIRYTPLGGIPELVKWSISIVRTPGGWVGRLDDHINDETVHMPVHPELPEDFIGAVHAMSPKRLTAYPLKKRETTYLQRIPRKENSSHDGNGSDESWDWLDEKRWYEEEYNYDDEIDNQLSLW